ncbi:MAG: N-acetylmuramoyl-L-alanine amidase [Paracoccaceae bacterium]
MIVIHYTAMESCAAARARLCDPAHEVSAHYLIDVDGTVISLVPEDKRAWHAGAGMWAGRGDVNSRSIGIELANDGATPFAHRQMVGLEGLLSGVMSRWKIGAAGVIGHSDMAPDRKGDPGVRFDWRRLARAGLAVWPEGAPPPPQPSPTGGEGGAPVDAAGFWADLRTFGYPADPAPEILLSAFRLRFRPWANGPLDAVDALAIADLARRYPAV